MAMLQEADWESVVPLAEHWPSTGEIKFDEYLSQTQQKIFVTDAKEHICHRCERKYLSQTQKKIFVTDAKEITNIR